MRPLSTTMTPLSNSSVLSNLHLKINSSEQPSPWLNNSTWPPIKPSGFGMTCFTLTFGAISNLTALGILARDQRSRQSKAPFLLLTVALLLTDLGGHVIPGAFALYLHVGLRFQKQVWEPNKKFCQIFGASMVFFGLCPLLFGCAMAVERCVAITKPFFHNSKITLTYMRRVVFLLFSIALTLAVLPLCALGTYTTQYPGTWCFLPIHTLHSTTDSNLILVFSSLGLAALTLSLLCNILSGLALLQTRMRSHSEVNTRSAGACTRRPSSTSTSSMFYSLDVEMMAQLVAITVISSICWSPFLIHMFWTQFHRSQIPLVHEKDDFALLSVRMASWNQILDPWVYILLRRVVFYKVFSSFNTQRPTMTSNCSFADASRRPLNPK